MAKNRAFGGYELVRGRVPGDSTRAAKFTVDSKEKIVVVRFGKSVTARDIEQYAAHLRDHSSFRPGFSEIADLRDVEDLELKADEFIRLADEVDPFSHEAKRAFVVANSVQAHAARMHKILRTQRFFEIFHSFEEAEQWVKSEAPAAAVPRRSANPQRRLR